jgi:hypothetical protein
MEAADRHPVLDLSSAERDGEQLLEVDHAVLAAGELRNYAVRMTTFT